MYTYPYTVYTYPYIYCIYMYIPLYCIYIPLYILYIHVHTLILYNYTYPYTLCLHADDSYLLFANHFFILRCNLDGTNLITLLTRESGGAAGIEFDLA